MSEVRDIKKELELELKELTEKCDKIDEFLIKEMKGNGKHTNREMFGAMVIQAKLMFEYAEMLKYRIRLLEKEKANAKK